MEEWWITAGVCVATEAELRAKWEQALGPNYQVLVSPDSSRLCSILLMDPSLMSVCVFQVVEMDPVIDDAELQKSSKVSGRFWHAGSDWSSCSWFQHLVLCCRPASAGPHSASRCRAGLVWRSPLHLLCGSWRSRGPTRSPETRGWAAGGKTLPTSLNAGIHWSQFGALGRQF